MQTSINQNIISVIFQFKSKVKIQSNENEPEPQKSNSEKAFEHFQQRKRKLQQSCRGRGRRQPVHHEEKTFLEHSRNSFRPHRSQPPLCTSCSQCCQGNHSLTFIIFFSDDLSLHTLAFSLSIKIRRALHINFLMAYTEYNMWLIRKLRKSSLKKLSVGAHLNSLKKLLLYNYFND